MKKIFALVIQIFLISQLFAQSAADELESVSLFGNQPKIKIQLEMKIVDGNDVKTRELDVYMIHSKPWVKTLIQITKPGFLSKMKYLTHTSSEKDDISWLKTSRGVRRVGNSDKSDSLFDSDFTLDDVDDVDADQYSSIRFGENNRIGTEECRTIILIPANSDEYSRKQYYIDDGFLWGIDYFDSADNLIKEYRVQDSMFVDGVKFPEKAVMKNIKNSTYTELNFLKVEINPSFPLQIFNKAAL